MGFFVVLVRFSLFLSDIVSFRLEESIEVSLLETRVSRTRGRLFGSAHSMGCNGGLFWAQRNDSEVNMQTGRREESRQD